MTTQSSSIKHLWPQISMGQRSEVLLWWLPAASCLDPSGQQSSKVKLQAQKPLSMWPETIHSYLQPRDSNRLEQPLTLHTAGTETLPCTGTTSNMDTVWDCQCKPQQRQSQRSLTPVKSSPPSVTLYANGKDLCSKELQKEPYNKGIKAEKWQQRNKARARRRPAYCMRYINLSCPHAFIYWITFYFEARNNTHLYKMRCFSLPLIVCVDCILVPPASVFSALCLLIIIL